MYIKFKKGTEAESVAKALLSEKLNQHMKAVKIIQEETNAKIPETCRLAFQFGPNITYCWIPYNVIFEGNGTIIGYQELPDADHYTAKRRTKVFKRIFERFQNEQFGIWADSLEALGIYVSGEGWRVNRHIANDVVDHDMRYYYWGLFENKDGFICLSIHANCFDMIDFEKGNNQFTVENE